MKVCYLFQDEYPWDVRVEKIMNSLADKSIQGHIIARNGEGLIRNEQLRKNLYVHRTPGFSNHRLNKLINFPAFFSPIWLKTVLSVILNTSADLLIVRDLPLSITGLVAAKWASIPVYMDMAENYPAMIMDTWRYRGPKPIDRIIRNPWALKVMERVVLPRFDGILVVSKYSADRVLKIGCYGERIWIVRNTPRLKALERNKHIHKADVLFGLSSFVILYVGGLEETRGLQTVIKAMPLIVREIHNALLLIVGQGTSEAKLQNLAQRLGMGKHVIFKGWVEHEMVPAIVNQADICIVPHFVTQHTETTIPNKIFDYMAQKKPVLVTHAKALKDIIRSCNCGMIYHHNDYYSLANQIIALKDSRLRESLGKAGYESIKKFHNWSIDEKVLLTAIQHAARKRPY